MLRDIHPKVQLTLAKYAVFRILSDAGFATPFFVVFMIGNGVTFTDIAIGTSVMAVAMITLELPSGYLADRVGRKRTLFLSQLCLGAGAIGYVFASSTIDVVLLYLAFGVGAALRSGAGTAWFYDTLKEYGEEQNYTAIAGQIGSYVKYIEAATMIGGGFLFLVEPMYAIAVGGIANLLAAVVVITFPQNKDFSDDDSTISPVEAGRIAKDFVTDSSVRVVLLVSVLGLGAMYTASKYIQPAAFNAVPEGGYDVSGLVIPAAILVSATYAIFQFGSGFAMRTSDFFQTRLGISGTMTVAYGGSAVCMIVPFFVPTLTLPAVILLMSLPMLAEPAVNGYLNDQTTSVARATVMSVASFLNALLRIPIMLGTGVIADIISAEFAMGVVGILFLIISTSLLFGDQIYTYSRSISSTGN